MDPMSSKVRSVALVVFAGILFQMSVSSSTGNQDAKQQERTQLIIRSPDGAKVISLGQQPDGSFGISLSHVAKDDQTVRLLLMLGKGGEPEVKLNDPDGTNQISMRVSEDGAAQIDLLGLEAANSTPSLQTFTPARVYPVVMRGFG